MDMIVRILGVWIIYNIQIKIKMLKSNQRENCAAAIVTLLCPATPNNERSLSSFSFSLSPSIDSHYFLSLQSSHNIRLYIHFLRFGWFLLSIRPNRLHIEVPRIPNLLIVWATKNNILGFVGKQGVSALILLSLRRNRTFLALVVGDMIRTRIRESRRV